ncbi:hypothetical protein NQ314_020873 [Rhamnusium bicolor]|uniref:propionyl-CoA carboxylase n=1 Tax=Rhamnusium bicolor TaxID=1586634 RepID=A0AAV8WLU4_9CUCU|nr:hypothetical protein NQ314_020873 [Rhamnusium bicolor]
MYVKKTMNRISYGLQLDESDKNKLLAMASAIYATNELRSRNFLNAPKHKIYGKTLDTWQLYIEFNGEKFRLDVSQTNADFCIKIDDKVFKVNKRDINLAKPLLQVKVDDEVNVIQLFSKSAGGDYQIISAEYLYLMPEKLKFDVSKQIRSPMPGLVKSVNCNIGDIVAEGQELCIIEAMKMQNSMVAATTGTVRSINIHPGDTISDDEVLIELA